MNNINNKKVILRQNFFNTRNNMSKDEVENKSSVIINRLIKMPLFINAKNIFCYISFKNEVNTIPFIKEFLNRKNIFVPRINNSTNLIEPVKLNNFDELAAGSFGILEPKTSQSNSDFTVDIFIIPGIVFDKSGNRIGFGYGYFDKFLANFNSPCIGLCYDFQVIDNIFYDDKDIKIDYIITESTTYKG